MSNKARTRVAGQAAVELASIGKLSSDTKSHAEQAAIGAATAGVGFGVGAAWRASRGASAAVEDAVQARRVSSWDDTLPPDRGFAHEPLDHVLEPGFRLNRYGYEGGVFASPEGAPFAMRSLPESYKAIKPQTSYEVLQPMKVRAGLALPWHGQEGLGLQYELPHSIEELIGKGILRRL